MTNQFAHIKFQKLVDFKKVNLIFTLKSFGVPLCGRSYSLDEQAICEYILNFNHLNEVGSGPTPSPGSLGLIREEQAG